MKKLKEIGLYYVLVGLETIENNKLDIYNKKSNISYQFIVGCTN